MITEETIRWIGSFLGGGVVVFLLDWFRAHRSEKKARRVSALSAQIQNLYGPLQFFSSQNESFFELNKKFHKAYKIEYEGEKWSRDEMTQKNLKQTRETFFDIANTYISLVVKNNESILDILKNNYAYIDRDDIEIFRSFVVDYTRLKTESSESGRLKTPLEIYLRVGEISFMRPEFISRVKDKFNAKKRELDSLIS